MLTCPKCKTPVDVPDHHEDPTIRCAICWAEVTIGPRPPRPAPLTVAAMTDEPPLETAPSVDLFADVPNRPPPAMVPLEDLLRRVAGIIPNLFDVPPPLPKPIMDIENMLPPRRPERLSDHGDEDLRRKRGTTSSAISGRSRSSILDTYVEPEEQKRSPVGLIIALVICIAVFVGGFLFFRYGMK